MGSRSSIFAFAGGPRAKWVVFLVWFVGIFIAVGPAQLPTKFTEAENNESTSFLPGDAESTKVLQKAEDLQGGELVPAAIVYRRESGLTAADRQKIAEDVERLTEKRFRGVIADGPTAAAGGQGGGGASSSEGGGGSSGRRRRQRATGRGRRPPRGRREAARRLRGPNHPPSGPARRLPAVPGRDLLARRQGRDHHRVPQGRRRVRLDPRPGPVLARHRLRPGRRAPGQGDRRSGLRRRRHRGLRVDQRHAGRGRVPAGDHLADHHLPVAGLPLHPARRGGRGGDAHEVDRLWDLRARSDHQRPVELDHVDLGAGRGH